LRGDPAILGRRLVFLGIGLCLLKDNPSVAAIGRALGKAVFEEMGAVISEVNVSSLSVSIASLEANPASLEIDAASSEVDVLSSNVNTASLEVSATSLEVDIASSDVDAASLEVGATSLEVDVTSSEVGAASLEVGVAFFDLDLRLAFLDLGLSFLISCSTSSGGFGISLVVKTTDFPSVNFSNYTFPLPRDISSFLSKKASKKKAYSKDTTVQNSISETRYPYRPHREHNSRRPGGNTPVS
jgi:hypothetical protein